MEQNSNLEADVDLACDLKLSSQSAMFVALIANGLAFLFPCKVLFHFLQFLSVPRIVPDIIIALLHGNTLTTLSPNDRFKELLEIFGNFIFGTYLFVEGLEMDLYSVLQSPTPATMVAFYTLMSTIVACCIVVPFINTGILGLTTDMSGLIILGFAVVIANTGSPLLTRLATQLKISKFEVGRIAVNAGITTDMLLTLVICVGFLFNNTIDHTGVAHGTSVKRIIFVFIEVLIFFSLSQKISDWIDERNPPSKKMDGAYVVGFLIFLLVFYKISLIVGYDVNINAFLIGLAMPKNGRMSRFLITNCNFFIDSFILPFIIFQAGVFTGKYGKISYKGESIKDELNFSLAAATMLIFWIVGTIGKISGVLLSGVFHREMWVESISVGLLLNVKGHFHVFLVYKAYEYKLIRANTVVAMLLLIIVSILYIPTIAFMVGKLARRQNRLSLMGFQWHNPMNDLRTIMCLYRPEDMPMALNIVEALRWGHGVALLKVFAMDLVELTERSAATLVQGEGTDTVMLADESMTEMREHIGSVLDAYLAENSEGISIHRLLAVSNWSEMQDDICCSADENMAVFILIPFHRRQMVNGNLDEGDEGHRMVNQKLQQHARCTVGILTERAGGRNNNQTSSSQVTQNIAVVYIGGADDREALIMACRMSQHPGIHLTVIRFLVDIGAGQTVALGIVS